MVVLRERLWVGLAHKPTIRRQLETWLPLILALIAYGSAADLLLRNLDGFTGDEPHYLLMAHSLCYDGDIDLKNNYEAQDYLRFSPDSNLTPHAYDYLGNGKLYSFHNIGLPLLLTLPYCLLGEANGVRVEMAILAGLASWAIFLLVRRWTNNSLVAWTTWAMLTFSSPLWTVAPQVYPDVVAVLGIALALLLLEPEFSSSGKILALSIVVAGLPWLHNRLAFLSLFMLATALVYLLRSRWRWRQVALLLILPLLSVILWMWSSDAWYGSPWPNAVYSPWQQPLGRLSWRNWYLVLVDLGLGREFGLLTYAPIYWVALAGTVAMVMRREKALLMPGLWLVGYVLAASLSMAAYGVGWGYYFPARLLLPVVPLLAIPLARSLCQARWLRVLALALFLASGIISVQSLVSPNEALADKNGVSEIPFLRQVQKLYPITLHTRRSAKLDVSETHRQVGQLIDDHETDAKAILAQPEVDDAGYMAFGPYLAFHTGSYTATFTLKTLPSVSERLVARIDASAYPGEHILAQRELSGRDWERGGEYQDFELTFSTRDTWPLEFRVYFTGQAEVWLQGIHAEPQTDLPDPASRSWPTVTAWGVSVIVAGLVLAQASRMPGQGAAAGEREDQNAA